MAGTYQKVIVVGRLGRDPELKYTQAGKPVCQLSLATDEGYKDSQGQQVDQTEWHRVVAWGKQAENVAKYLTKGRLCLVEGRLRTRSWEDQNQIKRYTTEINAMRVTFLGSNQGSGGVPAPDDNDAPPDPGQGPGPAFPSETSGSDDVPF